MLYNYSPSICCVSLNALCPGPSSDVRMKLAHKNTTYMSCCRNAAPCVTKNKGRLQIGVLAKVHTGVEQGLGGAGEAEHGNKVCFQTVQIKEKERGAEESSGTLPSQCEERPGNP